MEFNQVNKNQGNVNNMSDAEGFPKTEILKLQNKLEEAKKEVITLRRLLVEAADELRIHDEEYEHYTRQDLKDRMFKALEGKAFWLEDEPK